jgi:hypothetical protein
MFMIGSHVLGFNYQDRKSYYFKTEYPAALQRDALSDSQF